jgi:hypothetical protein
VNACVICGHESDVAVSLIEWAEPINERRFDSVPRCRDREACRLRLEAIGETWPVADGRRPVPA